MKNLAKEELYQHLNKFLESRGVELRQGSYAKAVKTGCAFLTDAINLSHDGLEKARSGMDRKLDQVRQAIHKATAPNPPPTAKASPGAKAGAPKARTASKPAAGRKPQPKRVAKPKRKAGA